VYVGDDYPYSGENVGDFVYAVQSVLPPVGFSAPSPVVSIELEGIAPTLASTRLPTELDLDDWRQGFIWFSDFDAYFEEEEPTFIEAEIHGLTPLAAGDFDFDADVDAGDLAAWRGTFASPRELDADADGDRHVDGSDFMIWQRQAGASAARARRPRLRRRRRVSRWRNPWRAGPSPLRAWQGALTQSDGGTGAHTLVDATPSALGIDDALATPGSPLPRTTRG
jgi:hypothetical protein